MRHARFLLFSAVASAASFLVMPVHAEEAAKAGLPQFDMSYFPGQIFWLAVTFTILYLLMSQIALPGVERTQEKRAAAIAAELAAASAANEEAKKIVADYEKRLSEARAEAQATVTAFTRRAAQALLDRQAEQQQKLNRHMAEAEARIAEARAAALEDAQTAIIEIAGIALDKVAGLKVKP
jgi:F-type H+-transporting ATPase subunit b